MSSATSIKNRGVRLHASAGKPAPPVQAENSDAVDAGFRPWHFFVLASLMAATVAVIMSQQSSPEHLILLSLTIAAAGLASAGFYRMLAPLTTDDPSLYSEPLSERRRATIEREKSLALRSIKELEFDRAMGKLSQKDFDEMAGRLRSRAITLMKELDEGGSAYATIIERELSARLAHKKAGSQGPRPAVHESAAVDDGRCAGCGGVNDHDAVFCKRCGTRLARGAAVPDSDVQQAGGQR
jgi:hypothetical protein